MSTAIQHVSFTALKCVLRGPIPVIKADGTQGWEPRSGRQFTDYDFLDTAGNPYTHQLWSKSAIEKFMSCNRKWAFQWLAGIREPMGKAAALGVDLHSEVEQWLLHGTPPQSKIITASGVLEKLPMPGTVGLQAERVFALAVDWVDEHGVQHSSGFWGFKDISVDSDVWDLKSKGDLAYAMTDSELADDLQACLYGLHACCETGSPTSTVTWAYIQTQGKPKYKPARATLTRDEMSRVVVKTLDSLTQMEQYRAQKILPNSPHFSPGQQLLQVMQVPPNPGSCAEYGGCFFRESHCTDLKAGSRFLASMKQERLEHQRHAALHATQPPGITVAPNVLSPTPPNAVTTTQGTPKMSTPSPVLARIQAQLAARGSATNVAAAAAAAPAIPVATQSAASVQAATQQAAVTQAAAAAAVPAATATTAVVATQVAEQVAATQPKPTPSVANKLAKLKDMLAKSQQEMAAGQVAVTPAATPTASPSQDAFLRQQAAAAASQPATTSTEAASAQAAQEAAQPAATQPTATEVLAQVEAAVDAANAQPVAQVAAPVKRSRGRPAGAPNKPKAAQPNLPLPVTLSPEDAAWQARADQWPRNPHLVLFIDVLPVKGVELHNIDDLIAPVRTELEGDGEGGVGTNYRLVEFGKGPALLAALLEEHFKAEPPMGEFFVLSKLVDAPVMEVLVRFAREVVKGAW